MLTKIGNDSEVARLITLLRAVDELVIYDPVKKFQLTNGAVSDYYADVKRALGEPPIRRQIAGIVAKQIPGEVTFVAASGYGGVPLGTEISTLTGLKLTMVRDKKKEHGKGGLIEGFVPKKGDMGIAIDDVLTTGGSLTDVVRAVASAGASISRCFVAVDRGSPTLDLNVSYILHVEDIRPR